MKTASNFSHTSAPVRKNPSLVILGQDFRPQRARRRIVISLYSALALVLCLTSVPGNFWAHIVGSLFILVVLYGAWVLNQVAVAYAADRTCAAPPVDERQEAVRNRAFFHAYQWICGLVSASLFYAMIADLVPQAHLWVPRLEDSTTILLIFFVLSVTIPNALIAWAEPDFLPESE